jgi:chromosome segregation ATPase
LGRARPLAVGPISSKVSAAIESDRRLNKLLSRTTQVRSLRPGHQWRYTDINFETRHLPSEIADLADELWQRSLSLAAQTATHDDNAARERLEQVKRENEVRSHALAVKEQTLREREASREKTVRELQEQVATLLSIVKRNTETLAALQAAKQEAEHQANDYRERLSRVITRAVARNKAATKPRLPKKAKNPRKLKSRAHAQKRVVRRPKKRSRR